MSTDTSSAAVITVEAVETVAGEVWSSLLLDVAEPVPNRAGDDTAVTASVSIAGAWNGHVTVGCSADTARSLTARMLGVDVANIEAGDVADVVGELANMIGGSLKALLPPPSTLSLPHVITGPGATSHFPHARRICRAVIPAICGQVTVIVWLSCGTSREENSR
jgi:chemotaxis protein CheX